MTETFERIVLASRNRHWIIFAWKSTQYHNRGRARCYCARCGFHSTLTCAAE